MSISKCDHDSETIEVNEELKVRAPGVTKEFWNRGGHL